ncbi:enoyl-CoA hydratase-related protein [Leptospira idonii]|uniref:Enoyl-CoA hydratase n=1 Tax=Leptospira idonii TaxID=1193500 RepID=A0A4R9LW48_9LEPT|nr:enoyl-CoA hydratase-related protein [Leptospira idonii]TGN17137.1 enoyl-CoA hydratase [Leptospira idonii]
MNLSSLSINKNYVAILRLNRPEFKNAISVSLLESLRDHIREVRESKARVLLIFGSEDSFSAGADLKERISMSQDQVKKFLSDIRDCFLEIESLPQPTLACINGFAFGGGLELALSCDLRYAKQSAVVGLTETKLGIIPGAGGTQRLTRLLGSSVAMEWISRAKKVSADEGLRRGLYQEVFPDSEFETSCLAVANDIAESAPIAVKAAKKAIKGASVYDGEAGLDWERLCYYETIQTKDRREALEAFREKRKPKFIGE